MLGVTGIMIAQRLARLLEAVIVGRYLRILLDQVVNHRVHFMRKEHSQLLADNLDAQGVDRADDRPAPAVERLQARGDVVPELSGNDPVESDHEDIVAVNTEAGGMQDTLDAPHEAEGLAATRPGDAPNDGGVRVDKNRHLRAPDAFIPG